MKRLVISLILLTSLCTTIFVTGKITGVFPWRWVWITSPIWILCLIALGWMILTGLRTVINDLNAYNNWQEDNTNY
jgi:energy-coupling factor transporter transmembrane protein EcfT